MPRKKATIGLRLLVALRFAGLRRGAAFFGAGFFLVVLREYRLSATSLPGLRPELLILLARLIIAQQGWSRFAFARFYLVISGMLTTSNGHIHFLLSLKIRH